MSKFINEDIYIEVDGHDLSTWAFNIDTPQEREEIDVSGFGQAGQILVGQRVDRITVQFMQDFDTGGPHDVIGSIFQNNTEVSLAVRPTSSAVSATNPELGGTAKIRTYNGLSGALNARSEFTVEFLPAGEDGFTWSDT